MGCRLLVRKLASSSFPHGSWRIIFTVNVAVDGRKLVSAAPKGRDERAEK